MIDFHNHILPDVDDGPSSMEESLQMLASAASQGITEVVNTVHFQHPKSNPKKVEYSNVIKVHNKLLEQIKIRAINIKVHLASEVFFLPNLCRIKDDPLATIKNKYMLIEFQPFSFPKNFEESLYELSLEGITPIIAHPERYRQVQENIEIIRNFIDRGYIIQIDAGSLLGHFGQKCKVAADEILGSGMCNVLGSDAHNNNKRNFCLKDALDYSKGKIGDEAVKLVTTNPQRIIRGEKIDLVEIKTQKKTSFFFFDKIIKRFFKG